MRVAFYGEFGTGNLGNDASLQAAVAAVEAHVPGADVVVLCNDPEAVTRRLGLRARSIRRHSTRPRRKASPRVLRAIRRMAIGTRLFTSDLFRMYRTMKQLDVVVVPGMGVLEAGWKKPGSWPAPLLMTVLAARLAGVPFAFVSIGAAAAHRRSTRALFRWSLRLASYRSFRDDYSRGAASGLGVQCESDHVFPDLAFGLEVEPKRTARAEPMTAGVGLIKYRAAFSDDEATRRDAIAAQYFESITGLVTWLLDRGLHVVLLTGDYKDEEIAEAVFSTVSPGRDATSLRLAPSNSFDELLAHLDGVDFVVGTRYHNIVAAALTATPVISISYKPKNDALLDGMGLGEFHQPLEQLDVERLRAQVLDLQRSADDLSKKIAATTMEYRDLVKHQWSLVASTLLSKPQVGSPRHESTKGGDG